MQYSDLAKDLPTAIHASAVSVLGQGVLIIGPSGSGKSSLALQLMAYGAGLISDDLVWLMHRKDAVWADRPPQIQDALQIEARGFGLLLAKPAGATPLALVLDLSKIETERLPRAQSLRIGKHDVRCFHKLDTPAFPAMILQYLSWDAQA